MTGRPGLLAAIIAATLLVTASPAMAAADLSISATPRRATLLRGRAEHDRLSRDPDPAGPNGGSDPTVGVVTVTDALPAGLSALMNDAPSGAGPVAASGTGWTRVATTCTRIRCSGAGRRLSRQSRSRSRWRTTRRLGDQCARRSPVAGMRTALPPERDPGGGRRVRERVVSSEAQFGPPVPRRLRRLQSRAADGCTVLDRSGRRSRSPRTTRSSRTSTSCWATSRCRLRRRTRSCAPRRSRWSARRATIRSTTRAPTGSRSRSTTARPLPPADARTPPRQAVHGDFFDLGDAAEANPQIERFEVAEGHGVLATPTTTRHERAPGRGASSRRSRTTGRRSTRSARRSPSRASARRSARPTRTRRQSSPRGLHASDADRDRTDYEPATTAAQTARRHHLPVPPRARSSASTTARSTRPPARRPSDAVPMIIDAAARWATASARSTARARSWPTATCPRPPRSRRRRTRCRTTSSSGPGRRRRIGSSRPTRSGSTPRTRRPCSCAGRPGR